MLWKYWKSYKSWIAVLWKLYGHLWKVVWFSGKSSGIFICDWSKFNLIFKTKQTYFVEKFITMKVFFVQIFKQNQLLWKFCHKATFCGNIPTKQMFVKIVKLKIFQHLKFLWKFINIDFCGIFLKKILWMEIFQQGKDLCLLSNQTNCCWIFSNESKILRKVFNKACFCVNFPTQKMFVEIFKISGF